MLEKIGLPPKPSVKGNTWVVDASHCQGCSSQFTFINRKHHCRRCGGIFCGSCTQQRMLLRGQGDSPVRICAPCKTLEEATRFEMRHGHKNKAAKGSSRVSSKEDEILNQIIGNEGKAKTTTKSASSSNIPDVAAQAVEAGGDMSRNLSLDQNAGMLIEMESATPEELREQAILEKQKYKTLKAEGKPEEALRTFKRGKELERQAGALEISIRKNRRMALSSSSLNNGESSRKGSLSTQSSRPKDDLTAQLKELGWSDIDAHEAGKKSATMSLDGELSSLLKEVSQKPIKDKGAVSTNKSQSQVIAHKKKALELKRSGNLLEAKEELKRAKILEKKIEEEELLGEDDESDDELSSLIRSMDDEDEHDTSDINFNFDQFGSIPDDLTMDGNFEVTEEDMDDPEMASALKSLGWEDTAHSNDFHGQAAVSTNESLITEVQSLKREALAQKRAGNTMEALTLLKKAKTLEMELENSESRPDPGAVNSAFVPKMAPKSKLTIQRELIALKKRALSLRREGKVDESQEELEKAKILEQQLEDMDKTPAVTQSSNVTKQVTVVDDGDDEAVTDQDMHDPSYLSLLKNLGWEDDNNEDILPSIPKNDGTISSKTHIESVASRKSKSEIQRELLSLKRKALTLRRQGEVDEADELLKKASSLEAQLKELEEPLSRENLVEKKKGNEFIDPPQNLMSSRLPEIRFEDLGKKEVRFEEKPKVIVEEKVKPNILEPNVQEPVVSHPQFSSLQQEILAHKRKALAFKREGKLAEAREELRQAKLLEKPVEEKVSQTEINTFSMPDQPKEVGPSVVSKLPLSSRDRFKIQQESLGHKRQALKLRREGKTAEADAEFELAKALESQLEDLYSQNNSSKANEPIDDVMVEDFLDPMLLSALQSIGLEGVKGQTPPVIEKQESSKLSADNSEREQLSERIKVEKIKAVNFKHSGKQAEALDALRRAKMYEKKLQMIT